MLNSARTFRRTSIQGTNFSVASHREMKHNAHNVQRQSFQPHTQYSLISSSFYLYSIHLIASAFLHSLIFSFIRLLFVQYSYHQSTFYLYSILFFHPVSCCTVFFSSIQLLFTQYFFIKPTST